MISTEQLKAAMVGMAVADALGVPVEFSSREERAMDPVTGMRGYGTHNQPPGTWSDDTSMALCLLESLQRGLDYADIADNFVKYYDQGYLTAREMRCATGRTTRRAIKHYKKHKDPLTCGQLGDMGAGNGSLMRILPIAFYLDEKYGYPFYQNPEAMEIIHLVSSITHAHIRCTIACGIYCAIAQELMYGADVRTALNRGISGTRAHYLGIDDNWRGEVNEHYAIDFDLIHKMPIESVKNSGYVVDTLIAALWCLVTTESYEACVLRAVNLGEDTDTVAAIAGGLAGICYGYDAIPEEWRDQLVRRELLESLCEALTSCHEGDAQQSISAGRSALLQSGSGNGSGSGDGLVQRGSGDG